MRTITAIAVGLALSVGGAQFAFAQAQPQPAPSAGAQPAPAATGDDLHFVSVLTLNGDVVAIDQSKMLVTVKGAGGGTSTLEVRSENELENVKPGDHVVVRYIEGAQVGKGKAGGATAVPSLKDGIAGAEMGGLSAKHPLLASVEGVDSVNEEITIKGPDGSLDTLEVTNPAQLRQIKVGDKIVITHAEALALSIEKQG